MMFTKQISMHRSKSFDYRIPSFRTVQSELKLMSPRSLVSDSGAAYLTVKAVICILALPSQFKITGCSSELPVASSDCEICQKWCWCYWSRCSLDCQVRRWSSAIVGSCLGRWQPCCIGDLLRGIFFSFTLSLLNSKNKSSVFASMQGRPAVQLCLSLLCTNLWVWETPCLWAAQPVQGWIVISAGTSSSLEQHHSSCFIK